MRWYLVALALVATGLAVWAGTNLAAAVPAAVLALTAAALLFAEAWTSSGRPTAAAGGRRGRSRDTLRAAFRSGRMGREAVVDLLDRLERAGPHPELPTRPVEELNALGRLTPAEFRHYVARRLDELEAAA